MSGLARTVNRLQHDITDLECRGGSEREKLDGEIHKLWQQLNVQAIKYAKLESAARVLGAELKGSSSISAILMMETQG